MGLVLSRTSTEYSRTLDVERNRFQKSVQFPKRSETKVRLLIGSCSQSEAKEAPLNVRLPKIVCKPQQSLLGLRHLGAKTSAFQGFQDPRCDCTGLRFSCPSYQLL
ncbi:Hypothetical predicted protein [Podarcis lilfordi]|uniref:Uncharacterized protein n=1 Tax=Podarcis lilfordi TaxID=74358 RepID=A0AA35NYJ8_9SAUR|nr:Hypothetical predicted protein [Podarcis lilfordi]